MRVSFESYNRRNEHFHNQFSPYAIHDLSQWMDVNGLTDIILNQRWIFAVAIATRRSIWWMSFSPRTSSNCPFSSWFSANRSTGPSVAFSVCLSTCWWWSSFCDRISVGRRKTFSGWPSSLSISSFWWRPRPKLSSTISTNDPMAAIKSCAKFSRLYSDARTVCCWPD